VIVFAKSSERIAGVEDAVSVNELVKEAAVTRSIPAAGSHLCFGVPSLHLREEHQQRLLSES